jgi:hypothetical protein
LSKAKTRSFVQALTQVAHLANLASKTHFADHHKVCWQWHIGDGRDQRETQTKVGRGFTQLHTADD